MAGCSAHPLVMAQSTALATRKAGALSKARTAVSKAGAGLRAAVRKVGGAAKSALSKTRHVGGSLVARERSRPDSVGNIISQEAHGLEAAAVLGVVDASAAGGAVKEATGFARPSDLLFGVGLIARATGLDDGTGLIKSANTAVIKAQAYDLARGIGGRVPSAIGNFLARHEATKVLSKTSGAEPAAAPEAPPVEGEPTES